MLLGSALSIVSQNKIESPLRWDCFFSNFSTVIISSSEWKIREKCARGLRSLRINTNKEITEKAKQLHSHMKDNEIESTNKHQGVLNLLDLGPLDTYQENTF